MYRKPTIRRLNGFICNGGLEICVMINQISLDILDTIIYQSTDINQSTLALIDTSLRLVFGKPKGFPISDWWFQLLENLSIPICEPWCWYIYLENWAIYGVNGGKYCIHRAYGILHGIINPTYIEFLLFGQPCNVNPGFINSVDQSSRHHPS